MHTVSAFVIQERRMRKTLPLKVPPTLIAIGVGAVLAMTASTARAESVTIGVDRVTTLNFMRAATPYSFDVSAAGFTERFTLFNPRELRFEAGKIRLKLDCRGEPVSVNAEIEPTLVIYFDRQKNAFVAKAQTLPVKAAARSADRTSVSV